MVYGQFLRIHIRGRVFRIMCAGDHFVWKEEGTFGGPNWANTMDEVVCMIEAVA